MLRDMEENFVLVCIIMEAKYIKAKVYQLEPWPLCLGNILKDFTIEDMIKTGLNGYVFSVDFNINDTSNVLDIQKYFIKKMFGFILKMFMEFLNICTNHKSIDH